MENQIGLYATDYTTQVVTHQFITNTKVRSSTVDNRMVGHFIFLESSATIQSIYGVLYNNEKFNNATGKEVLASLYPNADYFEPRIYLQLKTSIGFIGRILMLPPSLIHPNLQFGDFDMLLLGASYIQQADSLLPISPGHDRVYLVNRPYIGSTTYFLDSFDLHLWVSFLVMFIGIGLLAAFGYKLLKTYVNTSPPPDNITFLSILSNQGSGESPRFISRNLIFLSLSALVIVFHVAFEAFMSASLAVRIPDVPFNDLNGLLVADDYSICIVQHSIGYRHFRDHLFKFYPKLGARVNDHNCPEFFRHFNPSTGISEDRVNCPTGKVTVITDSIRFFREFTNSDTDKNLCRYSPLNGKYFPHYLSFPIYPGFQYREHFNRWLLKFRSSGYLRALTIRGEKRLDIFYASENYLDAKFDESVDLSQFRYVLITVIVGISLSGFILLVEILVHRIGMRNA